MGRHACRETHAMYATHAIHAGRRMQCMQRMRYMQGGDRRDMHVGRYMHAEGRACRLTHAEGRAGRMHAVDACQEMPHAINALVGRTARYSNRRAPLGWDCSREGVGWSQAYRTAVLHPLRNTQASLGAHSVLIMLMNCCGGGRSMRPAECGSTAVGRKRPNKRLQAPPYAGPPLGRIRDPDPAPFGSSKARDPINECPEKRMIRGL